jgi:cob(I)alamin adenosyltransferase
LHFSSDLTKVNIEKKTMSIVTKKGDTGQTTLMYNRPVPKTDLHLEAYGAADELTSTLGLARATTKNLATQETLLTIQKHLIALMGELATLPQDYERYVHGNYPTLTPQNTAQLEATITQLETQHPPFRDWAIPGDTLHSAALDLARTVARRAERHACALKEAQKLPNAQILTYLNRLSDLLWLLARQAEHE